jgi:hypothetical protein
LLVTTLLAAQQIVPKPKTHDCAHLSSASPTKAIFVLSLDWINNFAMQSHPCLNPEKYVEQYLE